MITLETRVSGFDARSWHRLITLVAPGLASRAPHETSLRAAEPGGTLLVLYRGDKILRALHTHRGVVAADEWTGASALGELAAVHGAHFALAAEAGAIEELYERLGGRLRTDDDFFTTLLLALGAARELHDEGAIHVFPKLVPDRVPLPTPAVARRLFDFLLPDGKSAVVALFDHDELDTAIVLRRRGAAIDRVWGPEVLREIVGPLGGDFRRDHRVVRRAIERDVAPVAFGLYSETATVHGLLRDMRSGAWAEAIALRDVVLDPLPAWMAVAAGAGAVRAAASRSKGLMAGLGILGAMSPTLQRIRDVADAVTGFDVEQVLGFNPLQLLAQVLGRSAPSGSRPTDEKVD